MFSILRNALVRLWSNVYNVVLRVTRLLIAARVLSLPGHIANIQTNQKVVELISQSSK